MAHLTVELTERQAELWHTSASFRAGAHAMVRDVVPTFLAGLAAAAEDLDAEHAARRTAATVAEASVTWTTETGGRTPDAQVGDLWCEGERLWKYTETGWQLVLADR